MTTSGIYTIKNLINDKMYVGQSINIERRWKIHKYKLNYLKHPNKYLQSEWDKYGKENFIFEIIEECDSKLLEKREKYWIKYYDANNPQKGYNIAKGGNGGNINYICSEETKRKIAKNNSIGKIVQLDFDGNIINIWNSVTEASRILKIHEAAILNCVKHNFYLSYGYIWVFYDEFYYSNFNIKTYINKYKNKLNPTILQYDLYGNLIKKWKWKEIKTTFKSYGTINKICRHSGHNLTYNNYIWLYEDDNFKLTQEYLLKCRIKSNTVKIEQYDLNNNLIKIWDNKEIKNSEYKREGVFNVCKKYKKTYKNYIWKFEGSNY